MRLLEPLLDAAAQRGITGHGIAWLRSSALGGTDRVHLPLNNAWLSYQELLS